MREVRADLPLVGQVGAERPLAADRVAAGAAVLDDPLVAGLELLGLGDVGHLVVALQAARLDEPLRAASARPSGGSRASRAPCCHSSFCSRSFGVCEA